MTTPEDNNPFAFPSKPYTSDMRSGMSLRDYFAAKALQGLVTAAGVRAEVEVDHLSLLAYALADAMLEERTR
jgi:hypothetical protein